MTRGLFQYEDKHILGSHITHLTFIHDDVIKWKHFPRYWPFVLVIHWSPVNSPNKATGAEFWCFLWFVSEQMIEQTIDMQVIWGTIALIMTSP